jgi:MscS family membrane protein
MNRGLSFAVSLILSFGALFALPGPCLHAQGKPDGPRRSPQATVRTLNTAITLARGQPQRIQEAIACLDLSGLAAGQRTSAGQLATELEAILRAQEVDTNLIPDKLDEDVCLLALPSRLRIGLRRMPDGRWLFDRETVAEVPRLYAQTLKQLQERNKEAAALNVSPEHASPRATIRTLMDGYRRQDFPRILRCLDLSEVPGVAREETGRQLASKLKQIILRDHVPILQDISDSNYSDPYLMVSHPEGAIELVRLASGPRKGEWVFSRDTVRSLDKLYVAFEDKPYLDEIVKLAKNKMHLPNPWTEPELWLRSHLPGWLRTSVLSTSYLDLEVYELLGYLLVPVLAFGLNRLTAWVLAGALHWALAHRGWAMPRDVLLKRCRPIGRFAGVLFLRWGLLVLEPDRYVLIALLVVLNPLVWLMGMWAAFRVLDLINDLLEEHLIAQKRRPELTQMFWPVASLAIKIGLFVYTMFHLMALFNWDVTAVVTGLGIGGLAFALGAQDALKNLFGSFTLIADRPFVVGESVKIGNHDVGVVEVVGLRSTRIRTKDDTLLIVPNSSLTTMEITNYGRRRYRRYQARIGISYSTPIEKIIAFRDGIHKTIESQERTRKGHAEVAINDLGTTSIEVLVNVYFEVADRHEELVARDALILDLLRLASELNIELSSPTQMLLVPQPAK